MKYYIISGYFAPIHKGHLDIINAASRKGKVIVIVNNDKQLIAKRGKAFIDSKNRCEVVKNLKGVYKTYLSIDKGSSVCDTLKKIRKIYKNDELFFVNGGDRNKNNIPENNTCEECNIKQIYNVGGKKVYSSRNFLYEWTVWAKKLKKSDLKKYNLHYEKH